MDEKIINPNYIAIKYSLIIAIINVSTLLSVYHIAPEFLVSIPFGIINMLLGLAIYVFFSIALRKSIGGYWSFSEAFKGLFIMIFIAGILHSAIQALYFNYVAPDAFEMLSKSFMDNTAYMFRNAQASKLEINKAINEGVEGLRRQYTPTLKEWGQSLGISILVYFMFAAILALIFRKEPVRYYYSENE